MRRQVHLRFVREQLDLIRDGSCVSQFLIAKGIFQGVNNVSISSLLAAWAGQGLFLPPGTDPQSLAKLPLETIFSAWLEERPFRIRPARASDLPQLVELEEACWAPALRSTPQLLLLRIEEFPEGQWALEMDGTLEGAIYSQRISEVAAISSHTASSVWELHDARARVAQFLAVNVFPRVEHLGLGDQLLEFALQINSARTDVERIVAVSLCKDFGSHQSGTLANYIHTTDDGGRLIDPILRFHQAHGASIAGLVPGFRPGDETNEGCGVLVDYDPRTRTGKLPRNSHPAPSATQPPTGSEHAALAAVKECMAEVKPLADEWSAQRALMDMGFESLQLLELRSVLSQRFGRNLPATFFFQHNTPERIARFLHEDAAPRETRAETPRETRRDRLPDNAIAIIGMACRWPGGVNSPDEFWELLKQGTHAVTEVPPSRWDNQQYYRSGQEAGPGTIATRFGGFIEDVDCFDAGLFSISPREASRLDPQQRMLLEVTWESLESAGIDPTSLQESQTGIFIGTFSHDYEILQLKQNRPTDYDTYFATGNSASVAAGRLAYVFGCQGPAMAVDTACSSSLVAVHLACRNLIAGDCELAIAGAANLLLSPELSIAFSRAGMLSPDGRCGTFDAAANGYVRSEGCGVIVLKSLARAQADGDPILGVIRGSAINQDGHSNGLTAPNGKAQIKVMEAALKNAEVQAAEIGYVEAHGTGTSLGDPVEFESISAVYGRDRSASNPLILGSVKTNIGHTEAAAGMAGLMKVVLSQQYGEIPRHLHFTTVNPAMDLDRVHARIPVEPLAWQDGRIRRAAVSSFGFSGTNAHVIVEQAQEQESLTDADTQKWRLLKLSGRNETAVRRLAERYVEYLAHTSARLDDICWTANTGRADLARRVCVLAQSTEDLCDHLQRWLAGDVVDTVIVAQDENSDALATPENSAAMDLEAFEDLQALRAFAERYVNGAKTQWRRIYRQQTYRRISLPTYPFERERYWLEGTPADDGEQDLIYQTRWPVVPAQSGSSVMPSPRTLEPLLADSIDVPASPGLLQKMEHLAIAYIAEAFDRLGMPLVIGDVLSRSRVIERMQVVEGQQALTSRMLDMLLEDRVLVDVDGGYVVEREPQPGDAQGLFAALLEDYPQAESELRMFHRCGSQLSDVLRGDVSPLQLVFPDADISAATDLYEDSITFGPMNALLRTAVNHAVQALPPERKVRILEIGAGTGGTTSHLLAALGPRIEKYVFTDVARLFVGKARERFGEHSFMDFEVLDIEKDPSGERFDHRDFDLVLASNVVHATADIRQTLKHVHSLLAPQGLMILVEGTRHQRWLDLIFGLLDGWWRFSDHDLRPDYPLLPAESWLSLLPDHGFDDAVAVRPRGEDALFDQALLVAKARMAAPAVTRNRQPEHWPEHWLVFCDESGVGTTLCHALVERGHRVTRVFGAGSQRDDCAATVINAHDPQAYLDLMASIGTDDSVPDVCVHLFGLDAAVVEESSPEALMALVGIGCESFLYLTQALIKAELDQPPRLYAVTRGAVAMDSLAQSDLAQAPICGLAEAVRQEHPEFLCRLIDLDPESHETDVGQLIQEITAESPATKVAFRGGTRREARLRRLTTSRLQRQPVIDAEAAYLIVGGLGGIGLEVTQWLVAQGARKLVIFGRSGAPAAHTSAASALANIEREGVTVTLVKGDVSRSDDVARLFETILQLEMDLKGIFHAAGTFEDRLLRDHSWDLFRSVMAAKVAGSWNLHRASRLMDLDLFVLFSSCTTLVCSSGLANYVAANAFLDSLASHRGSLGLPALSIAWGPWEGVGMAADVGGARQAQWAAEGLATLPAERALASLGRALTLQETQLAIMAMDWQRYADLAGPLPLIENLLEPAEPVTDDSAVPQARGERASAPEVALEGRVMEEVRRVLGLGPSHAIDADQGFFEMGLDSLTSMELRNRLQKRLALALPTTLAFRFPTVAALTAYLEDRLRGDDKKDEPHGIQSTSLVTPEDVDTLSDEQAEARLLERLAELGC